MGAFPAMQSLHALQGKSDQRKLWLIYWVLYVLSSWFMHYFECLVSIPFYFLSFYIDIYYEVQILIVLYLCSPKFMGLKKVESHFATSGGELAALIQQRVQEH